MATIFGTGLAVRVGLIFLSLPNLNAAAEPVYIAVSLGKNDTYADAYGPGVGLVQRCWSRGLKRRPALQTSSQLKTNDTA